MAQIDHTSQATFVATDPLSKTIFCCAKQSVVVAHPNIRDGGVKGWIGTFVGKMSTDEQFYLFPETSTENIKASITKAKYVIEVERNVDDGFQCRYFIESRDRVLAIEEDEDEAPSVQSTATTTSSSTTAVSTPAKSNKSKKSKEKPIKAGPKLQMEDVYVEVHVRDIFGDKNPAAWHINNCFMLLGCRFHQPFAGIIQKRVHVMKNIQFRKVWGPDEEPRKVTGEWLKGGHGTEWGV
ncbi:hypothetical protein DL95DRAFT_408279 [Leptodontidium sp. 2 PMI_412]|nr:hypothetical protein DL95DRAFT_408279 [Leptodontidium sp. 2 PMI_412]